MTRIPILSLLLTLLGASAALAQSGYEWDHPDEVGVRFLLYNKMKPWEPKLDRVDPYVKTRYVPDSDDEIIRVNGHPYDWGLVVYEFPKDGGKDQTSFQDYITDKDPSINGRQIRIESKPKTNGKIPYDYWEFYDHMNLRWIPRKKASAGLFWEHAPKLRMRFLAGDDMAPRVASKKTDGASAAFKLSAIKSLRVETDNRDKKLAWSLIAREFTEGGEGAQSLAALVADDKLYVRKRNAHVTHRTVLKNGDGKNGVWEFVDDYQKALGTTVNLNYYHVAKAYEFDGRSLALHVKIPVGKDLKPPKKILSLARKMVVSAEPFDPDKMMSRGPFGEVYYSVAANYDLEDREVALIVTIPVDDGKKPDSRVLKVARKMLKSLEPLKN